MIDIKKINALAELERLGWDCFPSGENEVKCKCPCHDDINPSLCLNVDKNLWKCQASQCNAKGDIISLIAFILKVERKTVIIDLVSRYPEISTQKVLKQDRVEEWHKAIWNAGPLLQELYKRGITDSEIRENRIGYSLKEQRIMIPIFDINRQVINVRKYLPGSSGPNKMKNMSGYTTSALYMPEQLKYSTIWVCGGELKALVAKRFLNPNNIGATSFTGGEGKWNEKFNKLFKGKIVFICMDVDAGGREGARRLAAQIFTGKPQAIYIINLALALDTSKYPKGDINDWVASEGAGEADFTTAMKLAVKYIPPYFYEEDDSKIIPIELSLLEARKSENIGKKCRCSFVVNMLDTENYLVPKNILINCTHDQTFCSSCIVNSKEIDESTGFTKVMLKPINQEFLGLIGISQSSKVIHFAILDALGIPNCKSAKIEIESYYDISDVRLGTELDLESNTGKTDINQPAFIVGLTEEQIELNTPYVGTGRSFPDPKAGRSVLLINKLERKEDSLSSFTLSEKDYELLKVFNIST